MHKIQNPLFASWHVLNHFSPQRYRFWLVVALQIALLAAYYFRIRPGPQLG